MNRNTFISKHGILQVVEQGKKRKIKDYPV